MMDNEEPIAAALDDTEDVLAPEDYFEYIEFPGGRLRVSEGTPADFSSDAVKELVTPLADACRELEPA
jgi:hypothetical protein